ncbi:acyl-CoA synthetase [Frankia sp. AgPm24]|uniref:acyl-CoA synthetase n=1 Tax=Frankia sp. AgPm24 TaxID=631128 RepID=UPI00200E7F25|nr:acyl-CoA synthetase [Frankia sp. AgPm24]MCK9923757.1 acyl-CoA synthetase [Frankia sp. AgPm24]
MYPGSIAELTPDKPAIVMARSRTVVTYQDLELRSRQLARLLQERGLRRGDALALLAENHPRFLEVLWAAMRSGLYLTAINRYGTAPEVAHILTDSDARALVTTSSLVEVAAEAVADSPGCATRLVLAGPTDPAHPDTPGNGWPAGFESYEPAIAACPAQPLAHQPRGDILLYSSGTTGRPKGIKRPLADAEIDAPGDSPGATLCRTVGAMDENSVYLCPAPLYHAAPLGWVRGAHEIGATVVVMEKFDAREVLELIERERVTHLQAVPTMLVRLLKLPAEVRGAYDLSSLRRIIHAGAPCPVAVKRDIIDWFGPIVTEYYSGTEGIGMTRIDSDEWLAHPGSVGRAVVGTIRVCGPDGALLPAGRTGSIYFERDTSVFEYHNDPDQTRDARHPDHDTWLSLGDLGYLDEDGYLYLTDRAAFTIISGGVNIYPAEIEGALITHPDVADVAVFGLPDPEMGEFVQAVVQVADQARPSAELAEQLRAHVRRQLSGPKVPRAVDFRDQLPRLPTGKLYKVPLRQEYLDRLAVPAAPQGTAGGTQ